MCEYGFEENIDYIKATQKKVALNNEGKNRAYNEEDYVITIDMAKEKCLTFVFPLTVDQPISSHNCL